MITSITDTDIRKLDAYRRTLSGAVATDKMQLLRGEATQINVSVLLDAVKAAKEIQAQRSREATEAARQEDGWGTVVVGFVRSFRKPFSTSVRASVAPSRDHQSRERSHSSLKTSG
jgi:hypothetical protein